MVGSNSSGPALMAIGSKAHGFLEVITEIVALTLVLGDLALLWLFCEMVVGLWW